MTRAIFFDLDGTLTDPNPGITGCIQFALGRLGHAGPSQAELEWCIGPLHVFVTRILDHFDLSRNLLGVFGSELDGTRSDKGELLGFALAETRVEAADSTMIGDRGHDAIGAMGNGMAFFGALYGYGSEQEFRDAGVMRWARRPSDLVPSLFADDV